MQWFAHLGVADFLLDVHGRSLLLRSLRVSGRRQEPRGTLTQIHGRGLSTRFGVSITESARQVLSISSELENPCSKDFRNDFSTPGVQ